MVETFFNFLGYMFISIPVHYAHTGFPPSSIGDYYPFPADLPGRWSPEALAVVGAEVSDAVLYVIRNILSSEENSTVCL